MSEQTKNLYTMQELEGRANRQINQYGLMHDCKCDLQEETYRTKLRRQRDKILYTGGFRRLQDKTQVMSATLKGDHRTRLTHTLEVEQIASSIADALGLNKDLVSAIALGHDVGHTPFGHAAERKLDELLTDKDPSKDRGGFHHPIQSVKYLWEKYGDNINDVIYEGILSHDSDMFAIKKEKVEKQLNYVYYINSEGKKYDKHDLWKKTEKFLNNFPSTLEAQVVIWADKIAYITHDLEDFINSSIYIDLKKAERKGCLKPKMADTEKALCDILSALIKKELTTIEDFFSRDLIRAITSNLIETSAKNIDSIEDLKQNEVQKETRQRCIDNLKQKFQDNCKSIDTILENANLFEKVNELFFNDHKKLKDIKKCYLNSLIINFEPDFRDNYYELRDLLDKKYIFSSQVQRSDAKAQHIVNFLYKQFTQNYKLTPLEIRNKIDEEIEAHGGEKILENEKMAIIERIVASYISTMSDTYAENMFCNLSGSRDNYSL